MSVLTVVVGLALVAWSWLVLAHGRFWVGDQRLADDEPEPAAWPGVVAVVPARDEADVIARAVASLVAQDYPGRLRVVLVDDESADGTAQVARRAALAAGHGDRLSVVRTAARPAGWVGKMWAVHSGVQAAAVARSAYTQLHHSPALLAGTLAGLALLYLVPPLALLAWPWHGAAVTAVAGAAAWLAMAATFVPTLALYGRSPALALALPIAGLLYAGMTFDSARRHWLGRGAVWKGRVGAGVGAPPDASAAPAQSTPPDDEQRAHVR